MIRILTAAALLAVPSLAAAQAMSPATYVAKAGAGDLYEIDSSKLLLTSTTNPKLKSFANMMVTDHTKSTAMVKAAAAQAKLAPAAPKLDAMQASNMAKLRAATGTARDQMYIAQQKVAHQQALALHQGYAANGTSAPLKAAAAKIAPVVETHIAALKTM